MRRPETQFARADGVAIAYQVIGDGPVDLVYATGWLGNIDMMWESPRLRAFLERLASFSRLIVFDKRGSGLSDRDVGSPTLEQRTDDIRAVMDAAGSQKASLFGVSEGGSMTCMFAASYPERTHSIILLGCTPCSAWKPDWPLGTKRDDFERWLKDTEAQWGNIENIDMYSPEMASDPAESAHWNRFLLHSASPSSMAAISRLNYEIDMRRVVPVIAPPALIVVRKGDRPDLRAGAEFFAENIANNKLVVLDGDDHLPWFGDAMAICNEMQRFVLGKEPAPVEERVLASVLMTDIVGSTETAAKIGDAAWRALIDKHDRICGAAITQHQGQFIKSTGDGLLAMFTGPSRAIACAIEIRDKMSDLGLSVRAGLHAGECLRRGDDISGMAVNLSARIADKADADQILTSGTVRDLVVGSDTGFDPAGVHQLKGVPGDWPLFCVAGQ